MKAVCRRFFILLALCAGIHSAPVCAGGFSLSIAPAGNKVVVSWPVAATNYVLQSTVSLAAPNWLTVANPSPVVVNNFNTVTYTNDSLTRFFRLYLNANPGFSLAIARAGNTFIISWPVTATNYILQTTTDLAAPGWLTVTNPAPVILNHTNFVTYTNDSFARFFRLALNTNPVSVTAGMVLIPAGAFTMGDVTDTNLNGDAAPVSVMVSAFYMDSNLVSYAQWQTVYNWATNAGYLMSPGAGKAANHPVQTVDWFDAVKWCNARSQQAGLAPVYYTDAAFTQAYTNGEPAAVFANWAANGYRLPTEAEWEKAARGGLSGQRFPWGNTVSESQANYYGDSTDYSYDLGPSGWNPVGFTGVSPYTSPVGSFPSNGYGLFDMAGNVCEWCWDWYGTPYAGGTDPRGPASGTFRVFRGGRNDYYAVALRCADRNHLFPFGPGNADPGIGFRCVKAP